jgi:hypothetical protein
MARRQPPGLRSGRFTFEAFPNADVIISQGNANQTYRILNSGESEFGVKNGAGAAAPLGSDSSFDFNSASTISISAMAGAPVQGIYEVVGLGTSIRSGRFHVKQAATAPFEIVRGVEKGLYRIFNSGKQDLAVSVAGGPAVVPVKPRNSLDVHSGTSIAIPKAAMGAVKGIYDRIDTEAVVRSGRFRNKDMPSTNPLKIIDMTDPTLSVPASRYRIFNAGQHKIFLDFSLGGMPAQRVVHPDQSVDIKVLPNEFVTVKAEADNEPIQVIYDLLPRE